MSGSSRWRTIDEIEASARGDCGPDLLPMLPLSLNLRHRAVEPAHPIHVVVLDAEGRLVPFHASSWRRP